MKPLKYCRHRHDERTVHYEDLCTLNQRHVSHPQWFSISLCMFREKAHTANKWFQRKTLAQKFCIPQVSYTWWRLWEISVCSILVFISICIYNYNWGNLCKKGHILLLGPTSIFLQHQAKFSPTDLFAKKKSSSFVWADSILVFEKHVCKLFYTLGYNHLLVPLS